MKKKIPVLLVTKDRPTLLEKVLDRLMKYTDWEKFDLWILDNLASESNKKIISMYKYMYPFINVYATSYNQLALIQNEVITKLKADFYIKIDDDILVTENWTAGFTGVYERHHETMAFGSVIIPVNGFGWVPFLRIMQLTNEFKNKFPEVALSQACMDVAVYNDKEVSKFIWDHCLDPDKTASAFLQNQPAGYTDLICPHRYSIGAIVFSHDRWQEMGGWFVQDRYGDNLKKQQRYNKVARGIKKIKRYRHDNRWEQIANILSRTTQGELGFEEVKVYDYSREHNLTIPVTTESLVFHFSFGPTDQYLMNTVYKRIKF